MRVYRTQYGPVPKWYGSVFGLFSYVFGLLVSCTAHGAMVGGTIAGIPIHGSSGRRRGRRIALGLRAGRELRENLVETLVRRFGIGAELLPDLVDVEVHETESLLGGHNLAADE